MKRLMLMWLVLAVSLIFTVGTARADYLPRVPGEGSTVDNNDPTGDDHPWGGEDQSTGWNENDLQIRSRQPIIPTGYPVIDIIFRLFHKDLWLLESRGHIPEYRSNVLRSDVRPTYYRTGDVNRFRRGGVK